MNAAESATGLLLFLALPSIFVAPVKLYPICFLLFICSAWITFLFSRMVVRWTLTQQVAWLLSWVYLLYVLFIYMTRGGDGLMLIKIVSNVIFFTTASFYFRVLQSEEKQEAIMTVVAVGLFVGVGLSFLQTLKNVTAGHLWLLPLQIKNSSDAYAIQTAGTIFFGDENKNIWATKTSIFYLAFFALRNRWRTLDWICLGMFIFTITYTSSRTAQLAVFVGIICYIISRKWPQIDFVRRFLLLLALFALTVLVVLYFRLTSIEFNVAAGNGGDGLMARVVLWYYFFTSIFHWDTSIYGHGVYAVSKFVNQFFQENNLHNTFLNEFYDFGLIGMGLYLSMLLYSVSSTCRKWLFLFVPLLFVVLDSQYFGYDPELMVLYAVSTLFTANDL